MKVEDGRIVLDTGRSMTGITWAGRTLPTTNYEIALQAMRVEGRDFFAGITFPVDDSFCSLILGGWGGSVVGLSSINGQDASENDTSQSMEFQNGRWYSVRIRVTPAKIEAWLDDRQIITQDLKGNKIDIRDRDGALETAWRGVVEDEIGAARYSPASPPVMSDVRQARSQRSSQRRNEVNGDERRDGRVRASRGR